MRPPRTRLAAATTAGVLALGLAACGGGGDTGSPSPTGDPDVTVTGTDALEFQPETLTASAGEITVALTAESGVNHDVVVEGEVVVEAPRGETRTGTIELEPGEYTFWCDVPGHRTAGMEGTLAVE